MKKPKIKGGILACSSLFRYQDADLSESLHDTRIKVGKMSRAERNKLFQAGMKIINKGSKCII